MIINPIFIYLINMMDRIERVFQVIGAMFVLIAMVYAVYGLLMQSDIDRVRYSDSESSKERFNQYRTDQSTMFKRAKKYFIISVAWILFTVLIPTRNTVIGMIATSYITKENIIATKEVVTDSIDYTITKILEITNSKKGFK